MADSVEKILLEGGHRDLVDELICKRAAAQALGVQEPWLVHLEKSLNRLIGKDFGGRWYRSSGRTGHLSLEKAQYKGSDLTLGIEVWIEPVPNLQTEFRGRIWIEGRMLIGMPVGQRSKEFFFKLDEQPPELDPDSVAKAMAPQLNEVIKLIKKVYDPNVTFSS